MSESTNSYKKVAVLTGLTMLVGGAEILEADAATVTETHTFLYTTSTNGGPTLLPSTSVVNFLGFNSALGTLTGVHYTLDSLLTGGAGGGSFLFFSSATVKMGAAQVATQSSLGAFDFTGVPAPDSLSNYIGPFGVTLSLDATCEGSCNVTWRGIDGEAGLTIAYDYSTTPIPAALPLFASGIAGLGAVALRNRRRQNAKKPA